MQTARRSYGQNWISILTVIFLLGAWEIAAHLAPKSPLHNSPIVPSWEHVFGTSLIGMSDYWKIPMWAPVPELGGEQTYLGAALAMGYHSAITLFRVGAGLILGAVAGIALGFALSWSPRVRAIAAGPLHFLRMCPLLAMIPLFQFWLGATNLSAIVFVAYGVGVFYLVGTINAVANVPVRYIEAAQTMGASKLRILRSIVLPSIAPELFSTIFLTLGLAWAAVVAAEYIGVDSGIGRMVIWADFFSDTGRMLVVTLFILLYAILTFAIVGVVQRHLLRWMPKRQMASSPTSVL